jgi:fatty-acid desaturase
MPAALTSVRNREPIHGPARIRRPILWQYLIPILTIHALSLLVLLPALFSWSGVALLLVGTQLFGIWGINIGYHRLLAHRSFRTYTWFERFLTIVALCSMQDTPARWVATHRLHHRHADEVDDPHSPLGDFVWSHIGWLFRRNPSLHHFGIYHKYAHDVLEDRFFMWLEKRPAAAGWIYLAHGLAFYLAGLAVGLITGNSLTTASWLGLSWVVWGVLLRTVAVWHITWSVNSLTHLFGYQTYETGENSRNNWFVAIVASGEGWHNNHHWDPASVSVRHRWWEFDSTYLTILGFSCLGLAWDLVPVRQRRRESQAARCEMRSAAGSESEHSQGG